MNSKELVRRAIEFKTPERLPFWQHFSGRFCDDVNDCMEMDRQRAGWFFDNPDSMDDWGCRWAAGGTKNMGQVVEHPLTELSALASYRPPNPVDSFYFARLQEEIAAYPQKYCLVTSHFGIFERMHMLHGFSETLMDLYDDPAALEPLADMVLDYKLKQFTELHRRFGDAVDGVFMTDDWGTQQNTFIGGELFREFFLPRYRKLTELVHSFGWNFILHSCGRTKSFIPLFIECGFDGLNIQVLEQDIAEIGELSRDKIAFLVMPDYQTTLQSENRAIISAQVNAIVKHWSTPKGGLAALCFGDLDELAVPEQAAEIMLEEFERASRT